MKSARLTIGLIIIILIVWGLTSLSGPTEQNPPDVTKVGVLGPFSGAFAQYGDEIQKGVLAAKTSDIEFIFEDTQCEPKATVNAYNKLTTVDGAQFLIGPACGSPQEAIIPLLNEQDVLTVVSAAASRELFEGSNSKFFQIMYALEDESKHNALLLNELGLTKVGLITYQNAFSETHANSFKQYFAGTIEHEVLADNTSDVASPLLKLKNAEIQAVYSPDMAFFFANGLEEMAQLELDVPVYSSYVVELPAAREFVEGVTYSFPANLKITDEGGVQGLSFEAAEVLVAAINECSSEFACVLEQLQTSSDFDEGGVSRRAIILKQIKEGEAVMLNN